MVASLRFIAVASLAALVAAAGEEDPVTALTPDTFHERVGKDVPAFVEFYAPWCGHCKNLAPDWAKLAETFKPSDGVLIAKVDADAHRELGTEFGVQGFPTLKWFPAGSDKPEDYSGGRSLDDLVAFVNGKTGLSKRPKVAPSAVTVLTSSNFDSVMSDPSKHKLVEYYAPWCGHCKNLAPTWEKLGSVFDGESAVVIAKVDADGHRDIGDRVGVKGFPTIKYYPAGGSNPDTDGVDYEGGRDLQSFVDFINEKAGTARAANGGLLPTAGRDAVSDAATATFVAAADKAAALASAKAAGGVSDAYIKVMEKVVAKGDGYVETELKRLEGLLSSGSVARAKVKDFQLRRNVLAAFREAAAAN